MSSRIDNNVTRPEPVTVWIDNQAVDAYPGESLSTVLISAGSSNFHNSKSGAPRMPYCNMGCCYECLVGISWDAATKPVSWVRACMTPVEKNLYITTGISTANFPVLDNQQ